ncbi:putative 14-3-3 protein 4-like [Capsicum annuum]|nr:putative 14-3-3 protein 4-like [Capsicum annuum]
MASRSHRGGDFYSAASYRCSDGLSTRQVGGSDEIQLRIDPMHGDLDDEITGLRKQVKQLRNIDFVLGRGSIGNNLSTSPLRLPINAQLSRYSGSPGPEVAQEIESEAKYQNDFINQLFLEDMFLLDRLHLTVNSPNLIVLSLILEGNVCSDAGQ